MSCSHRLARVASRLAVVTRQHIKNQCAQHDEFFSHTWRVSVKTFCHIGLLHEPHKEWHLVRELRENLVRLSRLFSACSMDASAIQCKIMVTKNALSDAFKNLSDTLHTQPAQSAPLKVGAVLLAAGAGRRLGGRPKSLLELDGVPLIRRAFIALTEAGIDPVVVVLGHHADAIEKAVQDLPVTRIRNPSPDDGPASSLRIGLQALALDVDAVLVLLADQPLIAAADIRDLIEIFKLRGDRQMVVPRVNDEPGNPVIVDALLRDEWLAGDVSATGQRWRNANPTRLRWFDTSNDHYCVDIDTPEDITRLAATTGRTLCWPDVSI